MSLIITVCTSEGIVMASDSRTTYNRTENIDGIQTYNFGIHFSDTTFKTFMCDCRIGISTCGNGTICGKSIASHIENYINNEYSKADSVADTARKILDYFSKMPHTDPVVFHIAGYDKENGQDYYRLYRVVTLVNINQVAIDNYCGAQWDGESAILTRLMKNGYIVARDDVVVPQEIIAVVTDAEGNKVECQRDDCMLIPKNSQNHPEMDIAWNLMTLQDGIDFAEYAIKTTIDTMRFQLAAKTVGNPIDILVIKADGAQWIKHKKLHA